MKDIKLHKSDKAIIKNKQRVSDHGEVFTNIREVNAMLDLVKPETERIESRFLEPACGDGNFLSVILTRKLNLVTQKYSKSQGEWERYSIIAVSSVYGVDILEDNTRDCCDRLFHIFDDIYTGLFGAQCKPECRKSVIFILNRNILWGDALDFTNPVTREPIVFSEWTPVNSVLIKRRDYMFRFLVQKSYQTTLLDENDQPKQFDDPVKDYPLTHFLKLDTHAN